MNIINTAFAKLGLNNYILQSLNTINYIEPSPIQEKCIPLLLQGFDVLGLAKTGSGKTAAFSLPLLNNLNCNSKITQILILEPTRELAIQVTKAIIEFSKFMKNINVLAVYGGQNYDSQLRMLRQGSQVVIGTPGRLLDHLRRGTLNLSKLNSLVLDEADEMLKMGFIEDVVSIMKNIPAIHQTALFSATMPEKIRSIIKNFMKNPKEIRVNYGNNKLPDIKQSYCIVYGRKKEALIRFLEIENFDAVIIFVKTKNATLEVSDILEKNGYNSAALNGDMNQNLREQTLEKLRNGKIDILIATDVAARGLDVERISLVINYDIPINYESYIHRIGRTGRAGRIGKALLFIDNNERRILKYIERNINVNISEVQLPDVECIVNKRLENFISKVLKIKSENLNNYRKLLDKVRDFTKLDYESLALFLFKIAQNDKPLLVDNDPLLKFSLNKQIHRYEKNKNKSKKNNFYNLYKIQLGLKDGLKTRNIISSISNELKINPKNIGSVKIFNNYSTIEISNNFNDKNFSLKNNIKVMNKKIKIYAVQNNIMNKKIINNKTKTKNKIYSFKKKVFLKKNNKDRRNSTNVLSKIKNI